jgi:beta-galactosidase
MNRFRRLFFLFLIALCTATVCHPAAADDISGPGWRLWPDQQAQWQNDKVYLPSEVNLATTPVNPPTGGWSALSGSQGIPVTLPSTVEEHYWGKLNGGLRPYTPDVAAIAGTRNSGQMNGNYLGVSWWWRTIQVPPMKPGQRLILHVRGARLRSEVYCNGKLCGYSIMTELPYDSDLTSAVAPGKPALLAIRITNPGGFLDWNDFFPGHGFTWGTVLFPGSHAFGGLDSGITLSVRDDVAVTDLATINTPDLHTIHLIAQVTSHSTPYAGPVKLQISRGGVPVWSDTPQISVKPGQTATVELDAHVPTAQPWDIDHPNLYEATAQLPSGALAESGQERDFGFRFFTAVGVKTAPDPILTFNGKRIVIRSAISWGFWGRDGLWPDEEMARREVTAAKALGLNCLQFHRNIAKPIVLDLQDRLGLLRYEEPGAGESAFGDRYGARHGGATIDYSGTASFADNLDTSGTGPDAQPVEFFEKYEEEKILEMVRRDRSHPAVIMYCLQNEGGRLDLNNPRIYHIMREMHALDPSRIILLNSGVSAHKGEALMLPYSNVITHSSADDIWGGWRDQHSVGGPGNYIESLYTDPTTYSQKTPLTGNDDGHNAVSMWGEMLGVGTPDNFQKLTASFDAAHPTGYDYDDDKNVEDATHAFLDTWKFRSVFPNDSDYFNAIGDKSYFFWQKIIEQARADNYNDYLVISGWESTTIDNHSGLVDNHRFFKGDPDILRRACLPEMLVVRPRHLVLAKGQSDLIDVYLVNETGRSGPHTLNVTVKRPDGSVITTYSKQVAAVGGNTYGQLLDQAIPFTADTAGMLDVNASLTPEAGASAKTPLTRVEQVNVVDPVPAHPAAAMPTVAVLEPGQDVTATLQKTLHITSAKYDPTGAAAPPDVIILASKGQNPDFDALAAVGVTPAPKGDSKTLDAALASVQNSGTRLILWSNGERSARWMVQELSNRHVVTLTDWVGHTGASWFGSWYVVRPHWLFDGLPTGCMDWRYDNAWQPQHESGSDNGTGGAVMTAPGMEVVCGYGNNNTKMLLGESACVIPYGKGQIIWYCLPQLLDSLTTDGLATNSAVAHRLLANAVCLGR